MWCMVTKESVYSESLLTRVAQTILHAIGNSDKKLLGRGKTKDKCETTGMLSCLQTKITTR